jgi:hypothetical protein
MEQNKFNIEQELNALLPCDFNLSKEDSFGIERLQKVCDQIKRLGISSEWADKLLLFLERMEVSEEIDPRYDLGTPGAVVHLLETYFNFKKNLLSSLARLPTASTVWMVNRILNSVQDINEWQFWYEQLVSCKKHPKIRAQTVDCVDEFIRFQQSKN